MRRLTVVVACCAALVAGGAEAADKDVLATVGDLQVTADEFSREIGRQQRGSDLRQKLKALDTDRRHELLDDYIDQKLLIMGALKEKLDQDPAVAADIREATGAILSKAFLNRTLDRQMTVPALKEYYDQNRSLFQLPSRVKARHILLKTAGEAEELLTRLKRGEDFCQLAALKSADKTTSGKCGELGWVDKGIMVKPFEESLFALHPGETSAVVPTVYGFHLIQITEKQEGTVPPFEAVRNSVEQQMRRTLLEQTKQRLRREFPVNVNNKAL